MDKELEQAIESNNLIAVKELLQNGTDPNIKNKKGKSPMKINPGCFQRVSHKYS